MIIKPLGPALNCAGRVLDLSRPRVMGILNVTPDSFSDGGVLYSGANLALDKVLHRVEQMVSEGADIIDIGGESTRPGAAAVSSQEEQDRVLPVIERLARDFDVVLSVDTSNPQLMLAAAASGVGFINDVRALARPGAIEAVAATGLPACLMHMQGEPSSMQQAPAYADVVADVMAFLTQRIEACTKLGVARRNLVIDPGFGFGKSAQHNLQLLNRLDQLQSLHCPILVGLSRKSLIGQVLKRPVSERLAGSLALAAIAAMRGAVIFRVHDVRETADAVRLCTSVFKEQVE
ncbi:MAG: dihydropteroate synthase [Verrucomicrobiaceae bacterium]|nr:dihydropteroate synthase [Verrucomicrobiaceae bacterium]